MISVLFRRKKMKFVIQRVNHAKVEIEGRVSGEIEKGLLVFIGIGLEDDEKIADKFLQKLMKLRIFADENGKTNLSIQDVGGALLLVSQFTLMANCWDGNRPSFTNAQKPDRANELYEYIIAKAKETGIGIQTGEFGADMQVNLVNDGPFTVILE